MYIGNNYMVSVRFYDHPCHQEYFIDENSARDYANRMYRRGNSKSIELFKRQRIGYVLVKGIVRHHEGSPIWN